MEGWIKLHRKLLLKGYYTQSQYVHLWVHLLLIANHRPNEYMTNGKIILIKEGQLLTGRKKLSMGTGIPESTVEDILKLLENEGQIQQQKNTKYRLITILNWKDYQQSDSQPTAGQQRADTNKNDKKEKKDTSPILMVQEEEERPRSPRPIPTAPSSVVEFWNSLPNWKATGKQGTPANPTVQKELLRNSPATRDITAAILRKRTKYSQEDFERAIRAYATDIANRQKDAKGFYQHRFTLYEFLVNKEVFERYVNR